MDWIIDRIEGKMAAAECKGAILNVPISFLPDGVKEGDIIELNINSSETEARRKKAKDLMDKLFDD